MRELVINEVDVHDDESFAQWHAVYRAASDATLGPEGAAYTSTWMLEEDRAAYRRAAGAGSTMVRRAYAGRLASDPSGPLVATGALGASLIDNLDRMGVAVHVHPDYQRRGLGSVMLAHLEAQAAPLGRTVLAADATYRHEAPADGAGEAGPEFCYAHGFRLGLGDVQRVLDLPAAPELLADLAREAAAEHSTYIFRCFAGRVPDDLAADFAALDANLITEAPMGELTVQAASADVAALREHEETLREQGRTRYAVMAYDAAGNAAGYTDAVVAGHEPGTVYQWGTLVWGRHRGHRLGLALKVANLRQLAAAEPELTMMRTWNAESNGPMIGVNERLGFRPVSRMGEFEKRLSGATS